MSRIFCKNCDHLFDGDFCPECGQGSHEHRVDFHYFIHDIPHSVFHVDGIFFSTFRKMFTKPGVVISEFLKGKRIRYFRPFAYVMVMTAISTVIVTALSYFREKLIHHYVPGFRILENHNFFEHYFSVFIFLMIPFASLVTWLFFIRRKYNFWEHFLANTYIAAQLNFIWIFISIVNITGIVIVKHYFSVDFTFFLTFFMMFFLYLYGSVFGYLMNPFYKKWILILMLTLMNLALFFVYSQGFVLAEIM